MPMLLVPRQLRRLQHLFLLLLLSCLLLRFFGRAALLRLVLFALVSEGLYYALYIYHIYHMYYIMSNAHPGGAGICNLLGTR